MLEIQELKKYGALAKVLIEKLTFVMQNLNKRSESLAEKLYSLEEKLQQSEKEIEINTFFTETQKLRNELLNVLIKKDRVSKLLQRNKDRLSVISKEIDLDEDIISESIKPALFEVKNSDIEVGTKSLGLSENEQQLLNLNGKLLLLSNGEIDLSNSNNLDIIKTLSYEDLNKLIYCFPKYLKELPAKLLFNSSFRINMLKALASYVFEEIKVKTLTEINDSLGEFLCFTYEISNSFEDYMAGVRNLFKVKIKQYLVSQNADQSAEISSKLICDESSRLLPEEYFKKSVDTKKSDDSTDIDIDAEIDAFLASLGS